MHTLGSIKSDSRERCSSEASVHYFGRKKSVHLHLNSVSAKTITLRYVWSKKMLFFSSTQLADLFRSRLRARSVGDGVHELLAWLQQVQVVLPTNIIIIIY
jgi:hypothetical protein